MLRNTFETTAKKNLDRLIRQLFFVEHSVKGDNNTIGLSFSHLVVFSFSPLRLGLKSIWKTTIIRRGELFEQPFIAYFSALISCSIHTHTHTSYHLDQSWQKLKERHNKSRCDPIESKLHFGWNGFKKPITSRTQSPVLLQWKHGHYYGHINSNELREADIADCHFAIATIVVHDGNKTHRHLTHFVLLFEFYWQKEDRMRWQCMYNMSKALTRSTTVDSFAYPIWLLILKEVKMDNQTCTTIIFTRSLFLFFILSQDSCSCLL